MNGKDLVAEWLSEITSSSAKTYQGRFLLFVGWKNPKAIKEIKTKKRVKHQRVEPYFTETVNKLAKLTPKQIKHLILTFQKIKDNEEIPHNTILAIITTVRSFYVYLEKPIRFRRGQLLKLQMAQKLYHKFSNGDLGRMYNVGNAFDKALLAVGVSLGWEISAILNIERADFENFVKRARSEKQEFFTFETQRKKTGVRRFGILNPLALEALENYLEVSRAKGQVTQRLFDIGKDGVSRLLQRLCREASITLTGDLRWHNLRKWLMSSLSRAKFNSFEIKYLMGKSIGISDQTYLETLKTDISEKYPDAYGKHLSILRYQQTDKNEVETLKAKIASLELIMRGMQEVYGEEITEKVLKRLNIKRTRKGKPTPEEISELLIKLAKA